MLSSTLGTLLRHKPSRAFSSLKRAAPYFFVDLPNKQTEVSLNGKSVPLGWFPTDMKSQFLPGFTLEPNPRDEPEILVEKPSLFRENSEFWPQASNIIKENIHLDPTYSDLVASETKTQYYHIYDFRLPPVFGRIPEVGDILGTVELEFTPEVTKIVPQSFEPNNMYRPITQYGAMLVSSFMSKKLAAKLGK